jgi:hypothetical protein
MDEPKQPWDCDDKMLVGLEEIRPGDELDEADRRAIADLDAGRFISNEAVMRWLQSIVDGNPIPRPQVGD